jgi:hypothetical protein
MVAEMTIRLLLASRGRATARRGAREGLRRVIGFSVLPGVVPRGAIDDYSTAQCMRGDASRTVVSSVNVPPWLRTQTSPGCSAAALWVTCVTIYYNYFILVCLHVATSVLVPALF